MERWNLGSQLEAINKQHLYRSREIIEGPQGAVISVGGQRLINFSSNDYLGLANHPAVRESFRKATEHYGVGSGSAHLICGHSAEHHALEEELAEFTGRDRALVFSTGFMANLGVITALLNKNDEIFGDKLNHASLIDGARLSGARFRRYLHNDSERLSALLESSTCYKKMIVTDGVFSMDGDEAPINEIVKLSEQSQSLLMVDDAHGIGVMGAKGGGLLEKQALSQRQVPILMGTLGKALGTFGAFIAGNDELIETLIQRARSYIYTTAPPAAVMAATRVSLKLCQQETWRRDKIVELAQLFRQGAMQLGLHVPYSETSIQPIILGDSERTLLVSKALKSAGFLVTAIRAPTVAKGSERLRITLTAEHTIEHVNQLLLALEKNIK